MDTYTINKDNHPYAFRQNSPLNKLDTMTIEFEIHLEQYMNQCEAIPNQQAPIRSLTYS